MGHSLGSRVYRGLPSLLRREVCTRANRHHSMMLTKIYSDKLLTEAGMLLTLLLAPSVSLFWMSVSGLRT